MATTLNIITVKQYKNEFIMHKTDSKKSMFHLLKDPSKKSTERIEKLTLASRKSFPSIASSLDKQKAGNGYAAKAPSLDIHGMRHANRQSFMS